MKNEDLLRDPDDESLMAMPFTEAKRLATSEFVQRYLIRVMDRAAGSVSEGARMSGLDRTNFRRLLQRYSLLAPTPTTEATREGAIMLLDMCALDVEDRRLVFVHEECEHGVIDAKHVEPSAVLSLALDARQSAAHKMNAWSVDGVSIWSGMSDAERYRLTCAEAASALRNGERIERR